MSIIDQIEDRYRSFRNQTTKIPKNLVLADWQLTQLIGELEKVSNSKIGELSFFKDMKILKFEETMLLAM